MSRSKKVSQDPVACQVGNCSKCTKIKQRTLNKLIHSVTATVNSLIFILLVSVKNTGISIKDSKYFFPPKPREL
jgi:hypothetical protein